MRHKIFKEMRSCEKRSRGVDMMRMKILFVAFFVSMAGFAQGFQCLNFLEISSDPYVHLLMDPLRNQSRQELVVAWDNPKFDPVFSNWLSRGIALTGNGREADLQALVEFTFESFSNETQRRGWQTNPLAKFMYHLYTQEPFLGGAGSYQHATYRMGDLLRIKCGVCRHSAVALFELLLKAGYQPRKMGGKVAFKPKGESMVEGHHAWLELDIPGSRKLVILDPANNFYLELEKGKITIDGRKIQLKEGVLEYTVRESVLREVGNLRMPLKNFSMDPEQFIHWMNRVIGIP